MVKCACEWRVTEDGHNEVVAFCGAHFEHYRRMIVPAGKTIDVQRRRGNQFLVERLIEKSVDLGWNEKSWQSAGEVLEAMRSQSVLVKLHFGYELEKWASDKIPYEKHTSLAWPEAILWLTPSAIVTAARSALEFADEQTGSAL